MSDTKPTVKTTLVLYTDAGARPNPGFGGWGMHGYLCTPKVSKQGSGHNTHMPTTSGYIPKNIAKVATDIALQDSDVLRYYDAVGTLGNNVSNNLGELSATNQALKMALEEKPNELLIRTDSQYVIQSAEKGLEGWERRNWLKPDGTEYRYKNEWEQHLMMRRALESEGISVKYKWVKGHQGEPGNELADAYATVGVIASQKDLNFVEVNKTDPKGYWKYDLDRHPFLSHNKMYFTGEAKSNRPGIYFVGNHGTDDALLGVQSIISEYAVVRLEEPQSILEEIRQQAVDLSNARGDYTPPFYYANLAGVYNPKFHQLATKFGRNALYPSSPKHNSLNSVVPIKIVEEANGDANGKEGAPKKRETQSIVVDVRPYLLAWRALEQLETLSDLLDRYLSADPSLTITPITDIFYETVTVKGKAVTRLKEAYKSAFKRVEVTVNYNVGKGVAQSSIFLTNPTDMPNRNVLKRIEEDNPQIDVITWRESDEAFRYATVVKANGAIGIWCGAFSNIRFLFLDSVKALREKKMETK